VRRARSSAIAAAISFLALVHRATASLAFLAFVLPAATLSFLTLVLAATALAFLALALAATSLPFLAVLIAAAPFLALVLVVGHRDPPSYAVPTLRRWLDLARIAMTSA